VSKTCGICQKPYRARGTLVLTRIDGTIKTVRACMKCVVNTMPVHVPNVQHCKCGALPVVCQDCKITFGKSYAAEAGGINDAIKRLEGLVKAHRSGPRSEITSESVKLSHWVEGLESAIDLLKSGRF